MVPASTQKLFTTWAALAGLTPAFRCTTSFYYTGKVRDGVLKGDLIIQGRGDPAFASGFFGEKHGRDSIFSSWLSALKNAGIREIRGCVMADGSYMKTVSPNPHALWEDIGNYYGGITSGLCFNDNRYHIFFKGNNRPGQPVEFLRTEPEHTGIARFRNSVLTGPAGSRDLAYIFGSPLAAERELRGTYPAGKKKFSIKGSLPHPPWTCAMEFRDFLKSKGISFKTTDPVCKDYKQNLLKNPKARWIESTLTPVAQHVSPSLPDIIRHVNRRSDNMYAEQLLCLLSRESGKKGNYREGLEVLTEYFKKQGLNSTQLHFKDGSGLSRYNRVSALQVCRLLRLASKHKFFPHFRNSLKSVTNPNEDLAGLGKGWQDRLWIKTGTMDGVYALAGYLKTNTGKLVCFFICFNNSAMKHSQLHAVTADILTTIKSAKGKW
jgi:D-alanyl-D-alanine carboxypeptidase/D-alanyl-D-alanine-endopeptidase (penicillin-binding protein 4)